MAGVGTIVQNDNTFNRRGSRPHQGHDSLRGLVLYLLCVLESRTPRERTCDKTSSDTPDVLDQYVSRSFMHKESAPTAPERSNEDPFARVATTLVRVGGTRASKL
eukprot:TRINITY_DN36822_c0_g2_i1.p1 TRINITY_DN36822_c0_g2~~TRINITY_DN36822_c0_g2_i1.p1  ORF type:complete len:105 (+),score=3.50 TRINITY_DN36822_c0_g2_i1:76-390(+)